MHLPKQHQKFDLIWKCSAAKALATELC